MLTNTEKTLPQSLSDLRPLAVTPIEATQLMRVGRSTVFALMRSGELPSIRYGRKRLIRVVEIEAWLDRQQTNTAAETAVEAASE